MLDEKTGMVTATQVEADDRRTIQLIKDVRDTLESCLDGAIYALNVYAVSYTHLFTKYRFVDMKITIHFPEMNNCKSLQVLWA